MQTVRDALPEPFASEILTVLKLHTSNKEHFKDHYNLIETKPICGSFGDVYHVSSTTSGKEYAIKKVTVKVESSKIIHNPFIQTFQECTLSRSIGDHPNLVRPHPDLHWVVLPDDVDAADVLEALEEGLDLPLSFLERFVGTEVYMVFDWYDDDLVSFLDRASSDLDTARSDLGTLVGISNTDSKRILLHILLGLCALHKNGVIHNDIKPNNILIDQPRDKRLQLRAVVADLGFVRYTLPSLATSMQRIRRHPYDAPDVCFTTNVDIWSFGLIAIQITLVFNARTMLNRDELGLIRLFVQSDDYTSLRGFIRDRLRGENLFFLESLVQCLQKVPKLRPTARVLYMIVDQGQGYVAACAAACSLHQLLGPTMSLQCLEEMIFPQYYENVFLVALKWSGKFPEELLSTLQELCNACLFPLPAAFDHCNNSPDQLQSFALALRDFLSAAAKKDG